MTRFFFADHSNVMPYGGGSVPVAKIFADVVNWNPVVDHISCYSGTKAPWINIAKAMVFTEILNGTVNILAFPLLVTRAYEQGLPRFNMRKLIALHNGN
ncbi:MAG TPA: hypothetical protein PLF42_07205, partial [Anaerolineales bacterium]|nr:hypothetical protein [Anaerolineales bacterium]